VPGRAPIAAAALVVAAALVIGGRAARAEPVLPPRVIDTPVARILPRGAIHGTAGGNHRAGGLLAFTGGLADLAELELGVTDDLPSVPAPGSIEREHALPLVAGFKLGVNQGTWHRWQPALALGFRTTAGGRSPAWSDEPAKTSALYAVVGAALGGGVRIDGGATLWASRHRDAAGAVIELDAAPATVRPFIGVALTPSFYPRTTLLADLTWVPELSPTDSRLRWLGAWGVRYQALAWGSIELLVRHREGDDLQGSTVMIRVNGVFPRPAR
jgi:hypothetical protein